MNAGVPSNVSHIQQQLNNARSGTAGFGGLGNSQVSNEQLVAALENEIPKALTYEGEGDYAE